MKEVGWGEKAIYTFSIRAKLSKNLFTPSTSKTT